MCIRVQRLAKYGLLGPLFHRMAQVHHQHIMRNVPHHTQVMRDKQIGQSQFLLQICQQIEHLGLNGDVKGRHRFIGHDQSRLEHQGARNRDALALSTREHVRITVIVLRAQAHQRQHDAGLFGTGLGVKGGVDLQWRLQNAANFFARIE